MTPLVSIVTPSYNQASFLEETMLSVLEQDYPCIEYIVMDGGSMDGSQEIIRRYESLLAAWVSEHDAGQSDAINKGWRKCTGEIFAYLNSDDVYMPGVVREVVDFFIAHPDVDLVYGDRIVIDGLGREKERIPSLDFSLETQIAESIPQECVFFRRRALDTVGLLNPDLHYLMDYDLWLRMLFAGMKFQHAEQAWGKYRVHATAKGSSQRMAFWREILRVLEDNLKRNPYVPPQLANEARSRLYFQAGIELACGGAREEGATDLRQSFSYGVLPFGKIPVLAARAANILVNALLFAQSEQPPDELFDWLLQEIPDIPARPAIIAEIKAVRRRVVAEYYLARAFDDYEHGKFDQIRGSLLKGARRDPAVLRNRGVWSIATKSFRRASANR